MGVNACNSHDSQFLHSAAQTSSMAVDDTFGSPSYQKAADVYRAVDKSIVWLETDMQAWRSDHGCAACHHGPMYLWSINVAKRHGYDVQEPLLNDLTQWLLTNDEARIFPKAENPAETGSVKSNAADRMTAAMMGHKKLSQPTLYLAHALNAIPQAVSSRSLGWSKVIDHLALSQNDDGSFAGRDAWRPIFNTPQILTRFVVAALQDAGDSNAPSDQQQRILRSAHSFLANQTPDETHQGLVLQLLCEPEMREAPTTKPIANRINELVTQLTSLQRTDGGWSQTEDRVSDAFATGQTLTALHRAGVSTSDPVIDRGIEFLLRTQMSDGTWPMDSRPNPENGKPADLLNPITYAATAWATIGLVSNVPRREP